MVSPTVLVMFLKYWSGLNKISGTIKLFLAFIQQELSTFQEPKNVANIVPLYMTEYLKSFISNNIFTYTEKV